MLPSHVFRQPADQGELEVGFSVLFSLLPGRVRGWSSLGTWTDGEERTIERIKATLPDAELAL